MIIPMYFLAQKQGNIWYFGDHAGLDFNSGNPITLNNGQTSYIGCPGCHSEGSSVIADSSGKLLFYCNGRKIWNKNHVLMQNGDSLFSNPSSTQGSLIVPLPGSSRYYYVFTTDAFFIDSLKYGFRYSVVDMCQNNGLGEVIRNKKNVFLLDTVSEKVTGVRHTNGIDYWIITHKFRSDAFYAYLLTSAGITNTVITHIGSKHTGVIGASIGQLKASPNGKKIALVNNTASPSIAEYFDFDKTTGIVSNSVSIQTNTVWGYYGVSFSPDNSKLYISCSLNGNGIYQFDLNAGAGNPTSVIASIKKIASGFNFLGLQLATNGKIYCARSPFINNPYLSVINSPNTAGTNCNYADTVIKLNGNSASYGLPNFIDSYDYSTTINNCEVVGIEPNTIEREIGIYPNPFSNKLEFKLRHEEAYHLTLFDFSGKAVFKCQITGNEMIETGVIESGWYYYKLQDTNGNTFTGKLVKE